MSSKLLDLEDRIVTDEGEVAFKEPFFVVKVESIEPFFGFRACEKTRELLLYNKRRDKAVAPQIEFWEDDGEVNGPPEETYQWTIPAEYQKLDVEKMIRDALIDKNLIDSEYVWRLSKELVQARERDMFPFIRCLVYIRDVFRKNDVVWGVGRGSSCASLIFYLLDINRVDPVKYEIPMEEFFKPIPKPEDPGMLEFAEVPEKITVEAT